MNPLRAADLGEHFVLDLTYLDAGMGELVGGKAANLGELLSAGARVPPGFCVTTRAYTEACLNIPGLDDLVEQLTTTSDTGIAELAGRIRALLTAVDLPGEVRAAITDAYSRLGADAAVAVRSSATAEDLPQASFAGQQDTYLNIVGTNALLDAVRRCWSSLWTDRAVFYRASNGIDHRKVRLAVVVQRMVDATASGVLFTANPVTGRRGEAVIDANAGLGESVVSGAINPDHFVVDTTTGSITQRQPGDKEFSVWSKPGGGTEVRPGNNDLSLTDDQLRELAARGREVEAHYQAPQDIEWALDSGGTLWLTQSRPVTTLFPLPSKIADGLRVYLSINLAQGVYRPLTPMGTSIMRLGAGALASNVGFPPQTPTSGPPAFREADGWLFIDLTELARNAVGRRIVPHFLAMMEARASKVFRWLLDDPRLAVKPHSSRAAVRVFSRVVAKTKFPLRVARAWLRPARARADVFAMAEDIRAELAASAPGAPHARLDAAQRGFSEVTAPRLPRMIPILASGILLGRFIPTLLGKSVSAEEVQVMLSGIPHNVTTEMDLELWRIAQDAAADPESAKTLAEMNPAELAAHYRAHSLPEKVQNGLRQFLARNGHRAVAEIDTGMPRWSEDPAPILSVLSNYVTTATSGHSADQQFQRSVRDAEDTVKRVVARLRRKNRLHGLVAKFALDRVRQLAGLREMPKYCLVLTIDHARRQLREAGESLVDKRLLSTADDIFFLHLDEVYQAVEGADVRTVVAGRRERYERELRRRYIPRMLLSDGTEPESLMPAEEENGALTGTSASAGRVTGIAKVVLDPAEAQLSPGEILVAPSTDPGWTPLFLTAGGLVMEMGGPNSHGATVAREYGIPAVVGVPRATQRITTGQRITVNGSAGTVEVD